jgi:hypothetical protein
VAISDPVAILNTTSTANATTYATGTSASLNVDDIVLIIAFAVRNLATPDAPTFTKTAGTSTVGTFTNQATGSLDSNAATITQTDTDGYRVTCGWVRVTGAGTLAVTATFANSLTGCHVTLVPLRGVHLTTPIRQVHATTGSGTRPTYSLTNVPDTGSWMYAFDSIRRNPPAWTNEGGSWIEDLDTGLASPANGMYLTHLEGTDQSTTYSAGVAGIWRGMMIEVAASNPDASITTTTVNAVTTVPTPATTGDSATTPTTVDATTAVPIPAATGDAAVSPTTVLATTSVPTPSVVGEQSPTIEPATVNAVTSVPTPATTADANTTPTTVDATTSIPTPAVTGDAATTPTTVMATTSVPTPAVTTDTSVTPTTVDATTTVPTPAVTGDANVTPSTVDATTTVPTPDVVGESGAADANVTPTTVDATTTVPTPAVTGDAAGAVSDVLAVAIVPTPAVTGDANVGPTTVDATTTVPTPDVTTGSAADADVALTTIDAVALVPTPVVTGDVEVIGEHVLAVVLVPTPLVVAEGDQAVAFDWIDATVAVASFSAVALELVETGVPPPVGGNARYREVFHPVVRRRRLLDPRGARYPDRGRA